MTLVSEGTCYFESGKEAVDFETRLKGDLQERHFEGDTPFTDGTLTSEVFHCDALSQVLDAVSGRRRLPRTF